MAGFPLADYRQSSSAAWLEVDISFWALVAFELIFGDSIRIESGRTKLCVFRALYGPTSTIRWFFTAFARFLEACFAELVGTRNYWCSLGMPCLGKIAC